MMSEGEQYISRNFNNEELLYLILNYLNLIKHGITKYF